MAVSTCQIRNIFCYCFVVLLLNTLLITVASASSDSVEASRKRGQYKFMRWGKRFFDDTDMLNLESSSEDQEFEQPNELPKELRIPIFGDNHVICIKIKEGGIYQCLQYVISADNMRHK